MDPDGSYGKTEILFLFEGKEFPLHDTVAKIWEDSTHWFEAQSVVEEELQLRRREELSRSKWEAPNGRDLKCKISLLSGQNKRSFLERRGC